MQTARKIQFGSSFAHCSKDLISDLEYDLHLLKCGKMGSYVHFYSLKQSLCATDDNLDSSKRAISNFVSLFTYF